MLILHCLGRYRSLATKPKAACEPLQFMVITGACVLVPSAHKSSGLSALCTSVRFPPGIGVRIITRGVAGYPLTDVFSAHARPLRLMLNSSSTRDIIHMIGCVLLRLIAKLRKYTEYPLLYYNTSLACPAPLPPRHSPFQPITCRICEMTL